MKPKKCFGKFPNKGMNNRIIDEDSGIEFYFYYDGSSLNVLLKEDTAYVITEKYPAQIIGTSLILYNPDDVTEEISTITLDSNGNFPDESMIYENIDDQITIATETNRSRYCNVCMKACRVVHALLSIDHLNVICCFYLKCGWDPQTK